MKRILKSVFIIAIVVTIGIMIPSVFALTVMPNDELPKGHIPVLDEKLVITQHKGYNYLQESQNQNSISSYSDSIIYGELVNISDDSLYYVIIRGNVYRDGKLLEDTGYAQQYIFRYNFPQEKNYETSLSISPWKASIRPGESAQFSLWPGMVGWDCYEVWIESYELENKFKGLSDEILRNDLEIKSVKDNKGVFKGKVYNPSKNILDHTYVIVSKYDQNGKIFAILENYLGPIEPDKTINFEIPVYLQGYPIKSHGDNFIYGEPANYEVFAWGYTDWKTDEWLNYPELDKHPVKFLGESKFFPNKIVSDKINIDEIIKNKENTETSSCLNSSDQVFQKSGYIVTIPEWIKNNAGWWSNGDIPEKEFLTSLEYLLENEILKINLPREKFQMELDSPTYYVTKYNSEKIKISGWYEDTREGQIECNLLIPNEEYADSIVISKLGTHGIFEQSILLNLDWKQGKYTLECSIFKEKFPPIFFDIVHGEPPQVDEKIKAKVPSWIKNNAGWWADDTINDSTFLKGLEYLVQNRIIDAGRYN